MRTDALREGRPCSRSVRAWIAPALVAASMLAIAVAAPVRAEESVWGMEGLGRPLAEVDLPARAAGGTEIAIDDPFAMSWINPAGIAHARLPQAHVGVVAQDRWISAKGSDQNSRRLDVRLSSLAAVFPLTNLLRGGISYRDLTDATYEVRVRLNDGREDQLDRTLTGRGGVSELSAALAGSFAARRLSAGVRIGLVQGTLSDERVDRYASGVYGGGKDLLRTRVRNGTRFGFGLQAKLPGRLSAGACWRSESELDLDSRWFRSGVELWSEKAQFDLPPSTGLGLAWRATPRLRFAADWVHDAWGGVSSLSAADGAAGADGGAAGFGRFEDTDRISIGVTRFPPEFEGKTPVMRRLTWRAGFYRAELPILQRNGVQPTEWALTGGVGVPVQVDRGSFDLLLEAGRTGDLGDVGVRETFFRLGAGYTFGRFATRF